MIHGRIVKALILGLLGISLNAHAKKHDAVPGEYVVKLKDRFATMSVTQLERSLGAQVVEHLSPASNAVLVRRSKVERADFAVQAISQSPLVEYAEPNYIYRIVGGATSLPNDPDLDKLWGLINTGQKSSGDMGDVSGVAGIDIDAKRAWAIETGSRDIVIASIDTGVDYTLQDLAPNMWVNEAEKNGTAGVDDDANGIVDDIHGLNAITNTGDPKDDHGHGSHTSGTIGAKGNDGKGIVGVAWNARIMGVKFLSSSGGGTLADAVKSIDYTTAMKVHMTSNSWGGGGYSEALYESIKRARDAGILFVAAAGNSSSNNDNDPEYPASYDLDNIISVAAIDNAGQLAYFSCFGKESVDVAAPGVNVYSSVPGNSYESWSGTSMAAPHVSGVAALLYSANPGITYKEVRERLIKTAKPMGSLRGKVASAGLVNAYHALMNTVPPGDPNDPFNWDKNTVKISTPHPYTDKYKNSWTVKVDGAKKIAIYFSRFDTELGYDKVEIKDGNGKVAAVISGLRNDSFSPVIEGDTAVITFTADDSATRYGFDIDGIAYK
jgi:subtilisin family serine protease